MKIGLSYANFNDCTNFRIRPIPWEWGKHWVIKQIDCQAETIAIVVNDPLGNYIEIYNKIFQPHIFTNLIYGSVGLPYHNLLCKLNTHDLSKYDGVFDQVLSWDSAIFFMDKSDRQQFWNQIDAHLRPNSIIAVSFLKFLNMSPEISNFMNNPFHQKINHHYRGEIEIVDFKQAPLLWPIMRSASEDGLFLSDQYLFDSKEYLTIPHLELIDPFSYENPYEALKSLKASVVAYQGIQICL